eukprot:TRINITY_DN5578_c0_g1_i1.p1 TRINITY_DN5578_c0_g1~~TRINITY_DN5578_c0_g1_i1.p1  ORF type:complete len:102 (-),score=12.13 TRINITY_DN5578_c0_g1_i1:91-396(-)
MIYLAVVLVLRLFTSVKTKETENLRLMANIGKEKTKVNKLYAFEIPVNMQEDNTKKQFLSKINKAALSLKVEEDLGDNQMQRLNSEDDSDAHLENRKPGSS